MRRDQPRPRPSRRGVTLIEMLVAVALLVLMMSILVLVFQRATGSIQEQRVYASLDQELRRIDSLIRQDLNGVTATMTPPNNPANQTGYFEYAENALADAQGEDGDDTLRFTVRAPLDQPFVGRVWLPKSVPGTDGGYATAPTTNPPAAGQRASTLEPVTITSDLAEVVYFLRNGNLYRRVVLIKPSLQSQLRGAGVGNTPSDPDLAGTGGRTGANRIGFITTLFKPPQQFASAPYSTYALLAPFPLVSWLGLNDLSARPSPFANVPGDLRPYAPTLNTLGDTTNRENRLFNPRHTDDYVNNSNGNLVPDGIADDLNGDGLIDFPPTLYPGVLTAIDPISGLPLVLEYDTAGNPINSAGVRAPVTHDRFAFPYVFPNAYSQPVSPFTVTGVHNPDPSVTPGPINGRPYHGTFLDPPYNHNPLDTGDNLGTPGTPQTWWGFPTWRETMSPLWLDPIKRLNDPAAAPYFSVLPASGIGDTPYTQSPGLSYRFLTNNGDRGNYWLPAMNGTSNSVQLYNDGVGSTSVFAMPPGAVWEEDLILSNVRSFDIKALDLYAKMLDPVSNTVVNLPSGYYDLGYANLIAGTPPVFLNSFAHEGRMPPLTTDYRADAQYPNLSQNIGDDGTSVVRLRRVWDSWSTAYSNVPGQPANPAYGPINNQRPAFPSYPAPYPAALRGIQIQIRVTDPESRRIKTLTIKQDFADKL